MALWRRRWRLDVGLQSTGDGPGEVGGARGWGRQQAALGVGKGKSLLYLEFESDAGEKNMGQVENIDDEKILSPQR